MPYRDMMRNYPKTSRDSSLLEIRKNVTQDDIQKAKEFAFDYFDGDRKFGLGGYSYSPKYFRQVVIDFINEYGLSNNSSILDVGCGKGFMLKDFKDALPNAKLRGLDISKYCLENSHPEVSNILDFGSCDKLPYESNSFDLVISIATIHNLPLNGVKDSIREIIRVSKKHSFIKVNGYKNKYERDLLFDWNLVAETILHVDEWTQLFEELGYIGDYSFFVP
jgi:SAM-dependent methyltransferase